MSVTISPKLDGSVEFKRGTDTLLEFDPSGVATQETRDNLGLGSAAENESEDFATAAQGQKADSALQTNTPEYNLPNTIHFTGRSDILPYVSTTKNIPIEVSNYIIKNIDGNVTLSFLITPSHNLTPTNTYIFAIDVYYTSGTITWPYNVIWPANEAPALTPNTRNLFFFIRRDNKFAGSYLLEYDMV